MCQNHFSMDINMIICAVFHKMIHSFFPPSSRETLKGYLNHTKSAVNLEAVVDVLVRTPFRTLWFRKQLQKDSQSETFSDMLDLVKTMYCGSV